jgi:hypothetical protein
VIGLSSRRRFKAATCKKGPQPKLEAFAAFSIHFDRVDDPSLDEVLEDPGKSVVADRADRQFLIERRGN